MLTYEALLSRPEHLTYVRAARTEIERLGGSVRFYPPNKTGLTLVEVRLPAAVRLESILPGLPFTLV
ncbi:MAG TPA: hypothetical protein VF808_05300 [Ktedonobacterales bacterium]